MDIERLTHLAENKEDISEQLRDMPVDQQIGVARRMSKINEQDRKDDPSLPKLELTLVRDEGGGERLYSIKAHPLVELTHASTWSNILSPSTDVYRVPNEDLSRAERADLVAQYFSGKTRN